MTFKKHSWLKYGQTGKICKIEIEDEDGRMLDNFKWNCSDKKAESKVFGILRYGHGIFSKPKEKKEKGVLEKDKIW